MNEFNSKKVKEQESFVRIGFWQKIRGIAAKIPFAKDAVELYFCAMDSKTPLHAKAIAFAALAYLILPLDAIPDIIPIAGYTDDMVAVLTAITSLQGHITDEHRRKAKEFFNYDMTDRDAA